MNKGLSGKIVKSTSIVLALFCFALFAKASAQDEVKILTITKTVPSCESLVLTYNGKNADRLHIRWFKDGLEIPGATGKIYTKEKISEEDAGLYYALVSNQCGESRTNNVDVVIEKCPTVIISKDFPGAPEPVKGMTDTKNGIYEFTGIEPNPVTETAKINFSTPANSYVKLAVVDMLGREVALLVDNELPAGAHEVTLEPKKLLLPSGMYFIILIAPDFYSSKSVIISK